MEKIRVLHVITGGIHREGISSTQLEFFKHINRDRFEILVAAVYNNDPFMLDEFRNAGCNIIVFQDRKKHTIRYFFQLVTELKKYKPHIIHVHGSSALMSIELLAAKIAGVKVRIAHSRNTKADQAKADKVLRPLFCCLYTDGMACGEAAGKWLFGEKKFTVIHNGKDFNKFKYNVNARELVRKQYHLDGKTVIGHVGNFNFQKNHGYLINVFNEYQKINPESVLFLMGEGPLMEETKKLAAELKIDKKVFFEGTVNHVETYLQAMDLMAFPSRFEGLPNVVLEWQAEGLPCLISDKITRECAPSDLVEFASIEDEPRIWAAKMEKMLQKYTNREVQAERGTQALKENGFDIVDATRQLENIYLNLLELHNKRKYTEMI